MDGLGGRLGVVDLEGVDDAVRAALREAVVVAAELGVGVPLTVRAEVPLWVGVRVEEGEPVGLGVGAALRDAVAVAVEEGLRVPLAVDVDAPLAVPVHVELRSGDLLPVDVPLELGVDVEPEEKLELAVAAGDTLTDAEDDAVLLDVRDDDGVSLALDVADGVIGTTGWMDAK